MNRISTLLGIRYPIIQGGMVWCSGWRLASAVSNSGGLGLIGAGSMHASTHSKMSGCYRFAFRSEYSIDVSADRRSDEYRGRRRSENRLYFCR